MTIRMRIVLFVTLIALLAAAVGVSTLVSQRAASEAEDASLAAIGVRAIAADAETSALRYMGGMAQAVGEIREGEADEARDEIAEAEEYDELVDAYFADLEAAAAGLSGMDDAQRQVAELKDAWAETDDVLEQMIMAEATEYGVDVQAGEEMCAPTMEAEELEDAVEESEETVDEAFDALAGTLDTFVDDAVASAESARSISSTVIHGGLLLIGVATVLFGAYLIVTIRRELDRAGAFATAVAAGDLGVSFDAHASDEIGVMTRSVEAMKDALAQRVENLREMAGVVMVTASDVKARMFATREALDRAETSGDAMAEAKAAADQGVASAELLDDLAKQMLGI